jgi:preprotein translocase subunit YajC
MLSLMIKFFTSNGYQILNTKLKNEIFFIGKNFFILSMSTYAADKLDSCPLCLVQYVIQLIKRKTLMFFISTAFADSAVAGPNQFMQFIPIIAIFVVFYFFMIRPQSKKAQEHKDFLMSLKAGTLVVTNSGIIGKVREIKNDEVVLEVASGTSIHVLKSFISSVYAGNVKISSLASVKKVESKTTKESVNDIAKKHAKASSSVKKEDTKDDTSVVDRTSK